MNTEKFLITLMVSVLVILGIIGGLRYVPENLLPQFLSGKQMISSDSTCAECGKENEKNEPQPQPLKVISITDKKQIEEIKNLKTPVVIKFFTDTCPACIQSNYPYQFVAAMLSDKVTFYEINVNSQQEITQEIENSFELQVHHIPTFVFVSEGKQVGEPQSGFESQDALKKLITSRFNLEQ